MTIIQRVQAPTPNFFKKVRLIGLIMASIGASLLAAPIALPARIVTIAGYLTVAGGVATALSQVTTPSDVPEKDAGSGS